MSSTVSSDDRMPNHMQARARKAEERTAKKEAEAAAKAKAKVSGESTSVENGPQDANKAAAPDAAVDTPAKMDSEGVGNGGEGALLRSAHGRRRYGCGWNPGIFKGSGS